MTKAAVLFSFLFLSLYTSAQQKYHAQIAALLDTIHQEDQVERAKIDSVQKQYGWQSEQMTALWVKMMYKDSVNLVKVKSIIDEYGWLGPEEVGKQGAQTIFLVIQHADSLTQVTYFPVLQEAVRKGKARAQDLAMLEDRILTKQGKEQIYGSQVRVNDTTGKYEFFPIKDESNVNSRRASVGLGPIEEYAKHFNIEYVPPKIKTD